MSETASPKGSPTASTSSTEETSKAQSPEIKPTNDEQSRSLVLRTLPLEDVSGRLELLADLVEEMNLKLAHVTGMAFGAGWAEFHQELSAVGVEAVHLEGQLSDWRMDLAHPHGGDSSG
jgi:hypothetical protein